MEGRVALGLSGGRASSTLLRLLERVRNRDFNRPQKHMIPFHLHAVHIQDPWASAAQRAALDHEAAALAALDIPLHRVPLESVYAGEVADESKRKERLLELVDRVEDPTGRDDLFAILRLHLLMHTARKLGCGTLGLGHDSMALAVRSIAAAAKGGGYSMTGDAHLLDARHGAGSPVLFYPLREISREEVEALSTRLDLSEALKSAAMREEAAGAALDKHNINALAAKFVDGILAHNPGAVTNILSTVSKLEPFPWNAVGLGSSHGAGETAAEREDVLCPLCSAPLAADELPSAAGCQASPIGALCDSCKHQIFGCWNGVQGREEKVDELLQLLPGDIVQRIWAAATAAMSGKKPPAAELAALKV